MEENALKPIAEQAVVDLCARYVGRNKLNGAQAKYYETGYVAEATTNEITK